MSSGARHWGVGLLVAAFSHGCGGGGETSTGECNAGQQLECGCPSTMGCQYVGCGTCVSLTIYIAGNQTCESGTWSTCDCYGEVEPECAGGANERMQQECSYFLRAVLNKQADGADEAPCRAAFVVYSECVGDTFSFQECTAERSSLDEACFGVVAVCS